MQTAKDTKAKINPDPRSGSPPPKAAKSSEPISASRALSHCTALMARHYAIAGVRHDNGVMVCP